MAESIVIAAMIVFCGFSSEDCEGRDVVVFGILSLLELVNLQLSQKGRSSVMCHLHTTHLCHMTQIQQIKNFFNHHTFGGILTSNTVCCIIIV